MLCYYALIIALNSLNESKKQCRYNFPPHALTATSRSPYVPVDSESIPSINLYSTATAGLSPFSSKTNPLRSRPLSLSLSVAHRKDFHSPFLHAHRRQETECPCMTSPGEPGARCWLWHCPKTCSPRRRGRGGLPCVWGVVGLPARSLRRLTSCCEIVVSP